MATLHVSWLGNVDREVATQPISSQALTTSLSSVRSIESPNALIVELYSDDAHYVAVGDDTVTAAASNSVYVPAGSTKPLSVQPGQYVAAITA